MGNHKLGIIGAGAFTDFSLESYKEYLKNLEAAAITDPNKEVAQLLADRYGIRQVVGSNEELLALPEIDVVLILTPPNTHYSIARQAIEAGKNVLVEKPIAFTPDEAKELIRVAEDRGLQLTANLVLRHHPLHQQLAKNTQGKVWGELNQILTNALLSKYPEGHWYWDEKISGGFFLNTFCHFLDLYEYIFNASPETSNSFGSAEHGYTVLSQFPNNRLASLNANLQVNNDQEIIQSIYCYDRAVIETNGWMPERWKIIHSDGKVEQGSVNDRNKLYRQILAQIMNDLLKRVDNPGMKTTINHSDLLNAVVSPTRAEHN